MQACCSHATQVPPSCASAATDLVLAHEFLVSLPATTDAADLDSAEAAVIDAAANLDQRMRNAARDAAGRLPGLLVSGSPASPLRAAGAAAPGGETNGLLRLLVDAVRTLAEIVALAVSMLLACGSLADISQGNVAVPVWLEDEEDEEEDA